MQTAPAFTTGAGHTCAAAHQAVGAAFRIYICTLVSERCAKNESYDLRRLSRKDFPSRPAGGAAAGVINADPGAGDVSDR